MFFEFLNKHHRNRIKSYFIINKSCPDFKIIKNIGTTIDRTSNKNKIFFLQADKIVSTSADEYTINPFENDFIFYRDLLQKQKFIFLQHGVILNNLSSWLKRYVKNVDIFITTSRQEYESIFKFDYYYSKNEVKLTGLARHDLLYNNSKKLITLMPTWRKYLADSYSVDTWVWDLKENFKKSEYYSFYNSLINDEKLLSTAKKLGYKIVFMPHPALAPHVDIFDKNDDVDFINFDKSYRDVYAESDLVLTDYSSAVFDFALLRKPVLYTQFDKVKFYKGDHICRTGYFDYESMGFGEVCYDFETTVNHIIEYMEDGCKLKDKYRQRIDDFFEYNDKNNCQRIFNAIVGK